MTAPAFFSKVGPYKGQDYNKKISFCKITEDGDGEREENVMLGFKSIVFITINNELPRLQSKNYLFLMSF